jgi:hypothetical protein
VLLAACGGGAPAVTPSSGAPTSEAAESTSPTESATPTETASEVLPANDVQDPLEALQAIWDHVDYLGAHPGAGGLDRIYHPDCDCFPALAEYLEQLDREGSRIEVTSRQLLEVELLDESQSTAQVSYRMTIESHAVINADGAREEQEGSDVRQKVLLLRSGGRWLLREFL